LITNRMQQGAWQLNTRAQVEHVESADALISCDAVYHNAAIRNHQHEHCRAERHEDCFRKNSGAGFDNQERST
jgi:hypothetical protein